MIPEEYKRDFMAIKDRSEINEFNKKHSDYNIKLIDFDDDMKKHLNELIKIKPYNPDMHTELKRK